VVIYAAIGFSAAKIAIGDGSSSQNQQLTARLMAEPFGRFLVAGAVGSRIRAYRFRESMGNRSALLR
jgi:Domain of Unknown Function (DUF1206)